MEQDAFPETNYSFSLRKLVGDQYNVRTILKVRETLMEMGLSEGASDTIINNLLNAGIRFEERWR